MAEPFVPDHANLGALARAAQDCQGCELYQNATQTVFGAGQKNARAFFVGEQPGDVEDKEGAPFVGPAGRLLDKAFADAEIDRRAIYLTNAVKHFRWKSTTSSARRLHAKPDTRHVNACRPWLNAELHLVQPEIVVVLGAVAASSVLGTSFRLTKQRGVLLPWPPETGPYTKDDTLHCDYVLATVHPSAVIRSPNREQMYGEFVDDLRVVAQAIS